MYANKNTKYRKRTIWIWVEFSSRFIWNSDLLQIQFFFSLVFSSHPLLWGLRWEILCCLIVLQRLLTFWKLMKGHWRMIILQTMKDVNMGKCFCIRYYHGLQTCSSFSLCGILSLSCFHGSFPFYLSSLDVS